MLSRAPRRRDARDRAGCAHAPRRACTGPAGSACRATPATRCSCWRVIGWMVLPHVAHLPWWCTLLAAVVLLWRGTLALASAAAAGPLGARRPAASAPGRTWAHRTLLGSDRRRHAAVALLALKTLELRARRDAFVVFFLGFFTMLTNFFFSQSLAVAAAMLVALLGLLTALVNAHMPVGRPPLRRRRARPA